MDLRFPEVESGWSRESLSRMGVRGVAPIAIRGGGALLAATAFLPLLPRRRPLLVLTRREGRAEPRDKDEDSRGAPQRR